MPLLKSGQFVDDNWSQAGEDSLPEDGKIIVSLEQFEADKETLLKRNGSLAVQIPNDVDVFTLKSDLEHIEMIVVQFPTFPDGRAYSQARQLRSELGFEGEIRAIGNILPDQMSFMRQCGINAFEVDDRFSEEVWQKTMGDMTLSYQEDFVPVTGDGPQTILARRRQAREKRGA